MLLALLTAVFSSGPWSDPRAGAQAGPEPPGLAISPDGADVPRLTPIRVTFPQPPATREGAELLRLTPPAPGVYSWLDERTLQLEPEPPGLLRGVRYTIEVPARPEAGLPAPVSRAFTTEGLLTVDHVIPGPDEAEVPRNAQVLVQFNRSVAPLTALAEPSTGPVLVADPPLPGRGEWLNTSLYRFVPDRLAPNTEYRLRVPAGLSSAADGALAEDFAWRFTTVSPALASVVPNRDVKLVGPRPSIVLTFNQPMDRYSVETAFRLGKLAGAWVPGAFAWSEGDSAVTFTPASSLSLSTEYELLVPAGLRGAAGGATKAEWHSTFTTVGAPTVSKSIPEPGSADADRFRVQITFSNPMDRDSADGRVLIDGIDPAKVPLAWGDDRNLFLNVALKPSTRYTVGILPGMTDRYGQAMDHYAFAFTTGALPSTVSFAVPAQLATFSATAEPLLYYHVINRASATFRLHPLTPEEARQLQRRGSIPTGKEPFVPSLPSLRTWAEQPDGGLNQVVLASTSLSGGGPLPLGDYYVESVGEIRSLLAFSVVNAALVTKLAHDELLVWALDHDRGEPLRGVRLHAEGPRLASAEATTDDRGLASFAFTAPATSSDSRNYLVTLDDGGHRGVASTFWQQGIERYQLNLPTQDTPRRYVGHLYTDRPIYRRGERVEYKAVLRLDDDAAYGLPPASPGLEVVLADARGNVLRREPLRLNDFGTAGGSFELPPEGLTGDYGLSIQGPRPPSGPALWVAGTSFLVADFRKPEFRVELRPEQPSYVSGETLDATAEATYFFGGPLAGAPARWTILSSPYSPRIAGFESYSFLDHDAYRRSVAIDPFRGRGTTTTDARGRAGFGAPAVLVGDEGPQRFEVTVAVEDQSAQVVGASASVTVHPAALYDGIRPAEYLGTVGREAGIRLVTVDTEGGLLPGRPVTVRVYERDWITTKEQTADGARRYRSEPRDTLVATLAAITDERARATVAYIPRTGGTLRLVTEAADDAGRLARSASYLWVSGGEARWQVNNNDVLQLVADKDRYEVGETAEVLVPAPFEGAIGLVTLERGKVLSRATRPFPTNAERLRIPITDAHVPNVYVSVVLYKPPSEIDPVPRYKVGYASLPVSTATRKLNVALQADRAQTRPGERVHYDLRVTDAAGRGVRAELSVAVVDKALLSLAEERGPDGLRAFWYERGLGVATASSLAVSVDRANDVIAESPVGGKGGGGLDDERLRQDFRNTALWEAQLQTDGDGRATVDVPVPDNLTTWRIQARAVSGGALVGEATGELLSTQPLILRPALPRLLRVGDSATLRLLVRNATAEAAEVRVGLDAQGLEIGGETTRTVWVPAGESALLEWPARATAEGRARLTFSAVGSGGLRDAVAQELPVQLPATPETTATGGIVTAEPRTETVYLPGYAAPTGGGLSVAIQASLVGLLRGELDELAPRPWDGPERVASRLIATAGLLRAERAAGLAPEASLDLRLDRDLASLVARQRPDGGWGWCDQCQSDARMTAWVLMALGEGRRAGRTVDGGVVSRAARFVDDQWRRATDAASPPSPDQRAMLLYALAAAGSPNRAATLALQEQERARLRTWGRAYLVLAMLEASLPLEDSHLAETLADLSATAKPSATGNHWEDAPAREELHSNLRATALALGALARAVPGHPLLDETTRWLVVARGARGWVSGPERAQVVLSLAELAATSGELGGAYEYRVQLNGADLLSGRFEPGDGQAGATSASGGLASLPAGQRSVLTFQRDPAAVGRLYYALALRYAVPAERVEALNRGVAVSHEYTALDEPGTPVHRARLGETVRVKVTVVAPTDLHYVVVDDLLPAGLEPVDPRLKLTDPALLARLEAERRKALEASAGRSGSVAPWYAWYYSPWRHVDSADDRVSLHADRLPKGVYEYVYYARATSVGDYVTPPAQARETYFPEVFGRSDSGRFAVAP